MEEFFVENLTLYGPVAIWFLLALSGFGVPLGEDWIVIPAGMLVHSGDMPLWPVVIASYLGVLTGDVLWFYNCSRFGTRLLHLRFIRRFVHPRRLLEAKYQIEQRGVTVIAVARFIPASRMSVITVAGLMHMPLWRFATTTAICLVFTVPMQVGTGYLIAMGLGTQSTFGMIRIIIGLVLLLMVVGVVLRIWRSHKRRGTRPMRARAAWLRHFRRPTTPRSGDDS